MRTSVNSSRGGGRVASASSTAAAASKPTTSKPASCSAVASTKRTLRSTSTTQTVAPMAFRPSLCGGRGGSESVRCQASPSSSSFDCTTGSSIVRSEEHTYELQFLTHISYAVFCLTTHTNTITIYNSST